MQKSKLTAAAEISQLLQIPSAVVIALWFQQAGVANPMLSTLVVVVLMMLLAASLNVFAVFWSRKSKPQLQVNDFRFYQGRDELQRIGELLKHGGRVHVITHVGGNIVNLQILEKDSLVDRIILQDPDGDEIRLLARAVSDREESELREQIKLSLGRAKKSGIKTRILDAPMSSVILGRAGNGRGWAHVEVFLPQVDARHRPSFFFMERAYPQAFKNLEKMFDETWNIARDA